MSLNKVMLIGNIGIAPELRYTAAGNPVVNLSIATEDKWRDKNTGDLKKETEWHRIVVWGNQATACENHLKVGSRVHVEGKLKTKKWENNGVTRYTTEIHSTNIIFLDGTKKKQKAAAQGTIAANIQPIDQTTINLATKIASQMMAQHNVNTTTATPFIPNIEEAYTDDMPEDVPF